MALRKSNTNSKGPVTVMFLNSSSGLCGRKTFDGFSAWQVKAGKSRAGISVSSFCRENRSLPYNGENMRLHFSLRGLVQTFCLKTGKWRSTTRFPYKKRFLFCTLCFTLSILTQHRCNTGVIHVYPPIQFYSLPWKFLNAKRIYGSVDDLSCRSFLQVNDIRLIWESLHSTKYCLCLHLRCTLTLYQSQVFSSSSAVVLFFIQIFLEAKREDLYKFARKYLTTASRTSKMSIGLFITKNSVGKSCEVWFGRFPFRAGATRRRNPL